MERNAALPNAHMVGIISGRNGPSETLFLNSDYMHIKSSRVNPTPVGEKCQLSWQVSYIGMRLDVSLWLLLFHAIQF